MIHMPEIGAKMVENQGREGGRPAVPLVSSLTRLPGRRGLGSWLSEEPPEPVEERL